MISILPARAYTPCRTISALSEASLSLRTLSRRAQRPQALCSASSRASCTWSRDDVNISRRPLVHTPWKHCGIRPASLFSTSTTRRLKLEDEATGSPVSRSGTEVGANFHINSAVPVISEDTALWLKPDLYFLHVFLSSVVLDFARMSGSGASHFRVLVLLHFDGYCKGLLNRTSNISSCITDFCC